MVVLAQLRAEPPIGVVQKVRESGDRGAGLLNVRVKFLTSLLNESQLLVDELPEVVGSVDLVVSSSVHFVCSCLFLNLLLDRYMKKHFNFFQIVLQTNNLKVIYKVSNTRIRCSVSTTSIQVVDLFRCHTYTTGTR